MSLSTTGETPAGPGLFEAFADPNSKVPLSCSFYDMVNSTGMKATTPESGWLPQVGFLYDTIAKRVADYDDITIKFMGDGVVVFHPGDDALIAIQIAIDVQETIQGASRIVNGAKGKVDFRITVGITTGTATRFVTPTGTVDYVGITIDKAARLCGVASAQAIFVDKFTITATNLNRVHSKFGAVVHRDADAYQGTRQSVTLKGITGPVEYHEIFWDSQLFGVKSELLTEKVESQRSVAHIGQNAPVTVAPRSSQPSRTEKLTGQVKQWNPEKNFGFITSTAGEDFYFNPTQSLVYAEDSEDLKAGTKVAFVALPAAAAGKSRRAGAMLLADAYADGTLVVPPGDRPYGWIEVFDGSHNSQLVYASREALKGILTRGSEVSFKLSVDHRGAHAEEITLSTEEEENVA